MALQLAFGTTLNEGFLSKLIAWKTGGTVDHVELLFSDGMCFSTHPKDGASRFKKIDFKPGEWVFEDVLMVPPEKERELRAWCEKHVGIPYGWETIFAIGANLPDVKNRPNTVVCSELCKAGLQHIGILLDTEAPGMTDPNTLRKEIKAWNAALLAGRYPRR